MQILEIILFLVLVFLVIYLPGRFLLRLSGYKLTNFIITFSSALIIGLSLFLLFTYILAWLKLSFIYNLVIPLALFFEFKKSYVELKENLNFKKIITPEFLLIILGSAAMAYTTWGSGVLKNGEMIFYGVNGQDSVYHIALIKSLIANFPPFHPGLAGIPLRGYNFFYDFLIANFSLLYHLDPFNLFFRYFSLFISLLLGFSSLSLAKFFKWKRATVILFIFLTYFTQSFDFLMRYLYGFFNYFYDSAGITQSLANALDPSVVISTSFMFIGFILLFSKGRKWFFLLPVLVIGVIPQIKIYSGIIFYLGLFSVVFWELYRNKNIYFLKILILSGIISAGVYLPINFEAGGLVFIPLIIFKHFIDSTWIFNKWHWAINFPIYIQAKNYLHISFFYMVAIAIFFITSLGVRILILLDVKKIVSKKFYKVENIFWFTSILGSFLIPSFFIQSVSAFSIIQFFWVGYIILLIPTAAVLGERLEKASRATLVVAFSILILLFLPDTVETIKIYSFNPGSVGADIVSLANIISKIPRNEGVIVADRILVKGKYQNVYGSPVISALSGHPIYYENELTEFQGINKIVDLRKENVDKIAANMVNCSNPISAEQNIINIMKKSNNKYLLVLKKNSCTKKFGKLRIVNEEDTAILYKI